ncbi:MAG: sulfotransferase [Chromatiaceae bacterium]|jgi:hypothetical protein|nr:sulfotransferase [Chromatiaceae bacterium]
MAVAEVRGAPVAVGGVGGSGTRLIAQVLLELGFYLGGDLNESLDNLWFTLLFKRREVLDLGDGPLDAAMEIFVSRMTGGDPPSPEQAGLVRDLTEADRGEHPPDWLRARAESLLRGSMAPRSGPWGWKEPNTHILIDRLAERLPRLRYIHVVRNGLDMAHSSNQNQLRFWGERFLGPDFSISPYWSLKYWHLVHRRVLARCAPLGERFLLLNYDRLCADPLAGLRELAGFLGVRLADEELQRLAALAQTPASVGRFKRHGLELFDPEDVAFVRQLGFDTEPG